MPAPVFCLSCFYYAQLTFVTPIAQDCHLIRLTVRAIAPAFDLCYFKFMKRKIKQQVYEYTVFFERNEVDGYTVTVPSLPGLVTEGRDLEEAKLMAEDAIRCHLSGLKKSRENIPFEREMAQL